ncbi:putative adhesin [Methylomonas fluvii]|uniref:Putative adhesin Stv domain-containing protein n=1 Tax=Methylomonas fluvii TaxID=1854564 RepID=A0ABR9D7X0_9GAMM|nr:hypothetical protein [Methylomonas fluvii]MBD9359204.1 hypothetical protein [Methylomonas fluvii]
MGMQHFCAIGHGGILVDGTDDPDTLTLPNNVWVVFYVPPGQEISADLATSLKDEIMKKKFQNKSDLEGGLLRLRGKLEMKPIEKNTPLTNYSHLMPSFGADWPSLITGGQAADKFLFNYIVHGPGPKDDPNRHSFGCFATSGWDGSDKKITDRKFGLDTDEITLNEILKFATEIAGNTNDTCVVHWLACRVENRTGTPTPPNKAKTQIQRFCLNKSATKTTP